MTDNEFEKMLKAEAKHFVPDNKKLIMARIPHKETSHPGFFMKHKAATFTTASAFSILIISGACLAVLKPWHHDVVPPHIQTNAYMSMKIIGGGNSISSLRLAAPTPTVYPEYELTIDENNLVTSYNPKNKDAKIAIMETNLAGLTIEKALEQILASNANTGYINKSASKENFNQVAFYVVTDDATIQSKLKTQLANGVTSYFKTNYIYGLPVDASKSINDVDKKAAEALNISVEKYQVIMKIMAASKKYTQEQLVKMTIKELNSISEKLNKNAEKYLDEETKDEIKEEAEKQFEAQVDTLKSQAELIERSIEMFEEKQEEVQKTRDDQGCKKDDIDYFRFRFDFDIDDDFEDNMGSWKDQYKQSSAKYGFFDDSEEENDDSFDSTTSSSRPNHGSKVCTEELETLRVELRDVKAQILANLKDLEKDKDAFSKSIKDYFDGQNILDKINEKKNQYQDEYNKKYQDHNKHDIDDDEKKHFDDDFDDFAHGKWDFD